MNNKILDFVKELTKNDKKNLTQKALKLTEETGEVAKNVLPYELASGTLHRVVHKDQIFENAIDSMLVSLSIAYSLGYTDNDIEDMMDKKSLYWSQLQQNEISVNPEKIPHELHVTVTNLVEYEGFKDVCKDIGNGVKPIVLELHNSGRYEATKDIMTSSIFIGKTSDALEELKRIKTYLTQHGYLVERGKIEAAPFHPRVPTSINGFSHIENGYFESHIEVYVDSNESSSASMKVLKEKMYGKNIHISSNLLKPKADTFIAMLTIREYTGTLEEFKLVLANTREYIETSGFTINGKDVIEYCLYDTNITQNKDWFENKEWLALPEVLK